ncbi:uncharacterized protein LOC121987950, partial [Zingiber officinale]|uniref:uncharacterized protein LOC121987950 n=1 Tax=Zingiber officinale TaxID=94328 RepID=UPI001C4C8B62
MEVARLSSCGIFHSPPSAAAASSHRRTRRHRSVHLRSRFSSIRVFAVATKSSVSSSTPSSSVSGSVNGAASNRFGNVSEEIKKVRKQMEEDEQLASLMRGLRGQNLTDVQFADESIRLRLVE